MKQAIVWADIPRCGLGNKLLVWARATWYAQQHDLPLVTTGWNNPIGLRTWLRGGGIRRYGNDFVNNKFVDRVSAWLGSLTREVVDEPELRQLPQRCTLYRFSSVPSWNDYFGYFKQGQSYIRERLWQTLSSMTKSEIENSSPVSIAVHIRHGDFRALQPGEDFAKVGQVRTSTEYFVNLIQNIRMAAQDNCLSVTVFSDGKDADLKPVLRLDNVRRAEPARAIVDIYRMARSRLLVCATGSTFSYWSAFLGDQPVVLHRDHIHESIRPVYAQETPVFEGGLSESIDDWPKQFISNLRLINW